MLFIASSLLRHFISTGSAIGFVLRLLMAKCLLLQRILHIHGMRGAHEEALNQVHIRSAPTFCSLQMIKYSIPKTISGAQSSQPCDKLPNAFRWISLALILT